MKKKIWKKIAGMSVALVLMVPSMAAETAVNTKFDFDKEQVTTKVNDEFILTLEGMDITDLYGFEVALSYDENQLAIVGKPSVTAIEGFSVGPKRADDNKVYFGCTQMGSKSGVSGNLELGELTFKAKAAGNYDIVLESITVVDSKMGSVKYAVGEIVRVSASLGADTSANLADIKGHWAEESIRKAVNAGYMVGKTETQFKPKDYLTRGEMAVILNRIAAAEEAGNSTFKDIKGTEWYADSIIKMSSKGLIKGYEDGTFRPKNNITRAETVALLARMNQDSYQAAAGEEILNSYKDAGKVPQWAKAESAWAVKTGLIKGDSSNKLNMSSNITRAEFAAILCRLLDL